MTERLSPSELEEIKKLADEATDGPWEAKMVHPFMDGRGQYLVGPRNRPGGFQGTVFPADAEFVAAARTAVPRLVEKIEEQETTIEWAMETIKRLKGEARQNKANWDEARNANLVAADTIAAMRPVVEAAQALVEQSRRVGPPMSLRMRHLHQVVAHYSRARGDHPERQCYRCGGPNVPWSAPGPLWNRVMRNGDINADREAFAGIVCPTCFAVLAQEAGVAEVWRFYAQRVHVELVTVTPSGRVWNPQTWLWEEPNGSAPIESPDAALNAARAEGYAQAVDAAFELLLWAAGELDAQAEARGESVRDYTDHLRCFTTQPQRQSVVPWPESIPRPAPAPASSGSDTEGTRDE